jgi:hypothetical protein
MRLILCSVVLAVTFPATAFVQAPHKSDGPQQDPTVALPKSYKLEFENDAVRVVRVHYDAKAALPEHAHPAGITVYLYFNASSGVLFSHDDGVPITRPAVKPGAIRIGSGPIEHHTVSNLADTPTDFIRVLLKNSDRVYRNRPSTRMPPTVMEYDNQYLRISRIDVKPGTKTRVDAKNAPMLRIAWIPGATEWKIAPKDGYRFLDTGAVENFEATGNVPMQLVTIELKPEIAKALQ